MRKLERRCPACGGKGSLLVSNGTELTYYCECDECHLRTRDCKSMTAAVNSWENEDREYFFYRKDCSEKKEKSSHINSYN